MRDKRGVPGIMWNYEACREGAERVEDEMARLAHEITAGPHQVLFGYTPAAVHRTGNKATLVEEYQNKVRQAQGKRLQTNLSGKNS